MPTLRKVKDTKTKSKQLADTAEPTPRKRKATSHQEDSLTKKSSKKHGKEKDVIGDSGEQTVETGIEERVKSPKGKPARSEEKTVKKQKELIYQDIADESENEDVDVSQKTDDQETVNKTKVFVGGLPHPFTDGFSIEQFFAKRDIKLTATGKPGKSYCICKLENEDDFEEMLDLHGTTFDDSKLLIRKMQPLVTCSKRVCLQEVDPSKVTSDDLKEKTGAHNATVISSKRLAYVAFKNESEAQALVNEGTLTVNGCEMTLELARPNPKDNRAKTSTVKLNRVCFTCGKKGHVIRNCPQKKK